MLTDQEKCDLRNEIDTKLNRLTYGTEQELNRLESKMTDMDERMKRLERHCFGVASSSGAEYESTDTDSHKSA